MATTAEEQAKKDLDTLLEFERNLCKDLNEGGKTGKKTKSIKVTEINNPTEILHHLVCQEDMYNRTKEILEELAKDHNGQPLNKRAYAVDFDEQNFFKFIKDYDWDDKKPQSSLNYIYYKMFSHLDNINTFIKDVKPSTEKLKLARRFLMIYHYIKIYDVYKEVDVKNTVYEKTIPHIDRINKIIHDLQQDLKINGNTIITQNDYQIFHDVMKGYCFGEDIKEIMKNDNELLEKNKGNLDDFTKAVCNNENFKTVKTALDKYNLDNMLFSEKNGNMLNVYLFHKLLNKQPNAHGYYDTLDLIIKNENKIKNIKNIDSLRTVLLSVTYSGTDKLYLDTLKKNYNGTVPPQLKEPTLQQCCAYDILLSKDKIANDPDYGTAFANMMHKRRGFYEAIKNKTYITLQSKDLDFIEKAEDFLTQIGQGHVVAPFNPNGSKDYFKGWEEQLCEFLKFRYSLEKLTTNYPSADNEQTALQQNMECYVKILENLEECEYDEKLHDLIVKTKNMMSFYVNYLFKGGYKQNLKAYYSSIKNSIDDKAAFNEDLNKLPPKDVKYFKEKIIKDENIETNSIYDIVKANQIIEDNNAVIGLGMPFTNKLMPSEITPPKLYKCKNIDMFAIKEDEHDEETKKKICIEYLKVYKEYQGREFKKQFDKIYNQWKEEHKHIYQGLKLKLDDFIFVDSTFAKKIRELKNEYQNEMMQEVSKIEEQYSINLNNLDILGIIGTKELILDDLINRVPSTKQVQYNMFQHLVEIFDEKRLPEDFGINKGLQDVLLNIMNKYENYHFKDINVLNSTSELYKKASNDIERNVLSNFILDSFYKACESNEWITRHEYNSKKLDIDTQYNVATIKYDDNNKKYTLVAEPKHQRHTITNITNDILYDFNKATSETKVIKHIKEKYKAPFLNDLVGQLGKEEKNLLWFVDQLIYNLQNLSEQGYDVEDQLDDLRSIKLSISSMKDLVIKINSAGKSMGFAERAAFVKKFAELFIKFNLYHDKEGNMSEGEGFFRNIFDKLPFSSALASRNKEFLNNFQEIYAGKTNSELVKLEKNIRKLYYKLNDAYLAPNANEKLHSEIVKLAEDILGIKSRDSIYASSLIDFIITLTQHKKNGCLELEKPKPADIKQWQSLFSYIKLVYELDGIYTNDKIKIFSGLDKTSDGRSLDDVKAEIENGTDTQYEKELKKKEKEREALQQAQSGIPVDSRCVGNLDTYSEYGVIDDTYTAEEKNKLYQYTDIDKKIKNLEYDIKILEHQIKLDKHLNGLDGDNMKDENDKKKGEIQKEIDKNTQNIINTESYTRDTRLLEKKRQNMIDDALKQKHDRKHKKIDTEEYSFLNDSSNADTNPLIVEPEEKEEGLNSVEIAFLVISIVGMFCYAIYRLFLWLMFNKKNNNDADINLDQYNYHKINHKQSNNIIQS